MTWPIPDLDAALAALRFESFRISAADAARQHATVAALLKRLASQPGVVLADEVGMGKTYVALGVATISAVRDRGRNPAVVMVPPSLVRKWPREANIFTQYCIKEGLPVPRFAEAHSALAFLRLLDRVPSERPHVVFLSHGAFHLTNIDHWTKFALITRAMKGMHLGERRSALPGFAATILRVKSSLNEPELYAKLLVSEYGDWRTAINRFYDDDPTHFEQDEPVPERVASVLNRDELDLTSLRDAIRLLPARESPYLEERLKAARDALREGLVRLWPQILKQARFRSPLLVLDEAHHVKNTQTRLASLFSSDSAETLDLLSGALHDRFERMLFLTATPFQLGHSELVNILCRFRAIAWRSLPESSAEIYESALKELSRALDETQQTAAEFDRLWQRIPAALAPADRNDEALETWWTRLRIATDDDFPTLAEVYRAYERTADSMRRAATLLRPWVVRHRRSAILPGFELPRRVRRIGRGIEVGAEAEVAGLPVRSDELLPFLLAARAQSVADRITTKTRGRYAVFSDGLASSFEAFLDTSKRGAPELDDRDDPEAPGIEIDERLAHYLEQMVRALPTSAAYRRHPKIAAVAARVLDLWSRGEKVVIFCHFRKTGQALVRHVSAALEQYLGSVLTQRTGQSLEDSWKAVDRFAERFDPKDPMGRYLAASVDELLAEIAGVNSQECERLHDVIRRFVRSPIFIARYFDPMADSSPQLMEEALARTDGSGQSLRSSLRSFLTFYATRERHERDEYLEALERVQPGLRGDFDRDGEDPGVKAVRLPNVRLANGDTRQDARQRLMLSFNTPFFPDVLVASRVLAEGVDLHLNCRHVIHHDLSWNPSDIEQRTGRVDRIECKAEVVGKSVEVYLPFVAETQDEKQFFVVMDRERWFNVLMSEKYEINAATIENLARRIPLPYTVARSLTFPLEVVPISVNLSGSRVDVD
jgi:hypothetical protein